MRKFFSKMALASALAGAAMLSPMSASAAGFGGYLQGAYSDMAIQADLDTPAIQTIPKSSDNYSAGAGLVFDSNLATAELVNYRAKLGYEFTDVNIRDVDTKETMHGINLDNAIGFGVVRSKSMRVWVGPELRFAYHWGTGDAFSKELRATEIAFGPTLGANFHMGKSADMCLSMGYRKGFLDGVWGEQNNTFTANTDTFFVDLSLIFRSLDDQFGAE